MPSLLFFKIKVAFIGVDVLHLGRPFTSFPYFMLPASRDIEWLGWLILCASLTGLRDAPRADGTLFLGVSVKVSVDEISI